LQKDDLHSTTRLDSSNVDVALGSLRQDLATEKKYYDQADKAHRDVQQSLESNKNQIKDVQSKIQILQNEIRELELAH